MRQNHTESRACSSSDAFAPPAPHTVSSWTAGRAAGGTCIRYFVCPSPLATSAVVKSNTLLLYAK